MGDIFNTIELIKLNCIRTNTWYYKNWVLGVPEYIIIVKQRTARSIFLFLRWELHNKV